MVTAIIIIVMLGILDAMVFIGCAELERRQEEWEIWHERSDSEIDE